ncbi:hypothetical protein [Haliangium sp.]|uniref:hypothetical protein n=1 Tax=Haliangium sp. TaxID=2663208 RepID=UPI003D0EAF3B
MAEERDNRSAPDSGTDPEADATADGVVSAEAASSATEGEGEGESERERAAQPSAAGEDEGERAAQPEDEEGERAARSPSEVEDEAEAGPADADAGRPIGRDEIDPELIALPRPRLRIGPLLALSVVVLSGYLMLRLVPDLRYSRQGPEPREVATAALLGGEVAAESYARVTAVPDRAFAIRVATNQAALGLRLVPAQGTGDRLWLLVDGNVWTSDIRYDEVYAGRLRQLADLPFADAVRVHVAGRAPVPRFVTAEQVRAALTAGADTLEDPAGDTVAVAADTPVSVYRTVAERVHIEVVPTERHPDPAAWTEALAALGLVAADARPRSDTVGAWVYTADAPAGLASVQAALEDAKLFAAQVVPVEAVYEANWGGLAGGGDALRVDGQRVPWAEVAWVSVTVPRTLPDHAWVLITAETPADYWYVLPLFALLALAALLFAWAVVRAGAAMAASAPARPS